MIGIDEVGRGAWAGPLLVLAARLKSKHVLPEGLTDSKLLSKRQRELLFDELAVCCEYGAGWVSAAEIDELSLAQALRVAAMRAIGELDVEEHEEIIIDGSVNLLSELYPDARAIPKADLSEPIVSAASVLAKVLRDKHMLKLHYAHAEYRFKTNVGYGTPDHLAALERYGVTDEHRKSFKPVLNALR